MGRPRGSHHVSCRSLQTISELSRNARAQGGGLAPAAVARAWHCSAGWCKFPIDAIAHGQMADAPVSSSSSPQANVSCRSSRLPALAVSDGCSASCTAGNSTPTAWSTTKGSCCESDGCTEAALRYLQPPPGWRASPPGRPHSTRCPCRQLAAGGG